MFPSNNFSSVKNFYLETNLTLDIFEHIIFSSNQMTCTYYLNIIYFMNFSFTNTSSRYAHIYIYISVLLTKLSTSFFSIISEIQIPDPVSTPISLFTVSTLIHYPATDLDNSAVISKQISSALHA